MRLITGDKCRGLVEALGEFFPEAAWQRYIVHFYRNVLKDVPRGKSRNVGAMLKAVHAQEDLKCGEREGGTSHREVDHAAAGSGRQRFPGRRGRNAGLRGLSSRTLEASAQ